jgi:hypothetical protein
MNVRKCATRPFESCPLETNFAELGVSNRKVRTDT